MSCAMGCIRWLLFIFNFLFCLCGLALIIPAAFFYGNIKDLPEKLQAEGSALIIGILIVGCIVFVIAFFGCCGAIKESHCMIITFAVLLLTILVIQVGLAIFAFIKVKGFEEKNFNDAYKHEVEQYWKSKISQEIVDFTQRAFSCCGAEGPSDFASPNPNMNGTIPITCCSLNSDSKLTTCPSDKIYRDGCSERLFTFFQMAGKILGGVALGIAGVELVGIIFALCLANSIRNEERRNYRV
ncbi:CD63 antigen-like isoform X1 [Chelonus insularis]|uniref:CD63 antigen-like isoform X1 n=1 Tax=Chelonus insularis TaxID=460826 RepID=UPI00158E3DA9|nr:CD63 antigen-like isoform X1 [Chelonus insularis]